MISGLKLKNAKGIEANLSKLDANTKKAGVKQINAVLHKIAEESLREVPKATGALAASLYVEEATRGNPTGSVGYGGSHDIQNPNSGKWASQYAREVHENLDIPHVVGKAKFLEDPFRRNQALLVQSLRKNIFDVLKNLIKW